MDLIIKGPGLHIVCEDEKYLAEQLTLLAEDGPLPEGVRVIRRKPRDLGVISANYVDEDETEWCWQHGLIVYPGTGCQVCRYQAAGTG